MQTKLACLSLAVFALAACDKSSEKPKHSDPSTTANPVKNPAAAPNTTETPAPPPLSSPVDAAPVNQNSPESLTPEQTIANYKSSGIPGIPQHVVEKIITNATLAGSPDDQLNIINQQTTAWHRINSFMETDGPMPEHMRKMLLASLTKKHGDSWSNMLPELDEQIAASVKLDALRSDGIPGMPVEESHDLIIEAMEKHGSDYKAILSAVTPNAEK